MDQRNGANSVANLVLVQIPEETLVDTQSANGVIVHQPQLQVESERFEIPDLQCRNKSQLRQDCQLCFALMGHEAVSDLDSLCETHPLH
jgi:hypothetical protein